MPIKAKKSPKKMSPCCHDVNKRIGKVVSYSVKSMEQVLEGTIPTCRQCAHLPMGATDLLHLLLVLIITLSAVLLTSIYALNLEQEKVATLQEEIQSL